MREGAEKASAGCSGQADDLTPRCSAAAQRQDPIHQSCTQRDPQTPPPCWHDQEPAQALGDGLGGKHQRIQHRSPAPTLPTRKAAERAAPGSTPIRNRRSATSPPAGRNARTANKASAGKVCDALLSRIDPRGRWTPDAQTMPVRRDSTWRGSMRVCAGGGRHSQRTTFGTLRSAWYPRQFFLVGSKGRPQRPGSTAACRTDRPDSRAPSGGSRNTSAYSLSTRLHALGRRGWMGST